MTSSQHCSRRTCFSFTCFIQDIFYRVELPKKCWKCICVSFYYSINHLPLRIDKHRFQVSRNKWIHDSVKRNIGMFIWISALVGTNDFENISDIWYKLQTFVIALKILDMFIQMWFKKCWGLSSIYDLLVLKIQIAEWGIKTSIFSHWFKKFTLDLKGTVAPDLIGLKVVWLNRL